MSNNALPISRLINVDVNLAPSPAQMQNISTLLILGSSNIIDVVQRIRHYTTLAEVAADFGTSAPEYLAASLWFEQAPQPASLDIGRWAKTATSAVLFGGALSSAQQALALWNAVTAPGFFTVVNGIPRSILPGTFALQTNLNGVASVIQTALAAIVAGTTCVWNAAESRFKIENSGTTGTGSTLSFLSAPTSSGYLDVLNVPTNGHKFTLNGTDVIFANPGPTSGHVTVGGTAAATAAALYAFLIASTDVQLVKFNYYYVAGSTKVYVSSKVTGATGDALTLAHTGVTLDVSGATLTGGTATDISTMLAMLSTSSGAYVAQGSAAETAVDAAVLFDDNYGQRWYGLSMLGIINSDVLSVAGYIEGANNKHIFGVTTQEAGVISSVDTSNISYQLKQLGYRRTVTQWSSSTPYAVCSLLGRILTTDYNGNNTVITLMYKQEPGIVPETLTTTQITALEANNCNVFVAYNNDTAIIEPGVVASGDFLDIITGTDWLALDIQTTLYNLLYSSTTKIPQTDAGNHVLVTGIESVCSQAVINGLLAPGTWTVGGFGSLNQGDFLSKGFYVYAPPVASQNPSNRAARKSVVFQIAAKLAGAIHTIDVQVNVNR